MRIFLALHEASGKGKRMAEKLLLMIFAAALLAATTGQTARSSAAAEQALAREAVRADASATAEKDATASGPAAAKRSDMRVLTPGIRVELLSRAEQNDPQGWSGGFIASPVSLSDLRPGDWVTVALEPGPHRSALSVQAVRPTSS